MRASDEPTTIEPTNPVFAARLASVLRTSRRDAGTKLRRLARASGGVFTVRQLRQLEAGQLELGGVDLLLLSELYEIDLSVILLHRVPLVVDPTLGRIGTAGITRRFEAGQPEAMLVAYLKLVRELRDLQHEPTILLRRSDIDALAASLGTDGPTVVEQLGELMHLTVTQRRSMVAAFVAGATLIALAGGAMAIDNDPEVPDDTGDASITVVSAAADDADTGTTAPPPGEQRSPAARDIDPATDTSTTQAALADGSDGASVGPEHRGEETGNDTRGSRTDDAPVSVDRRERPEQAPGARSPSHRDEDGATAGGDAPGGPPAHPDGEEAAATTPDTGQEHADERAAGGSDDDDGSGDSTSEEPAEVTEVTTTPDTGQGSTDRDDDVEEEKEQEQPSTTEAGGEEIDDEQDEVEVEEVEVEEAETDKDRRDRAAKDRATKDRPAKPDRQDRPDRPDRPDREKPAKEKPDKNDRGDRNVKKETGSNNGVGGGIGGGRDRNRGVEAGNGRGRPETLPTPGQGRGPGDAPSGS